MGHDPVFGNLWSTVGALRDGEWIRIQKSGVGQALLQTCYTSMSVGLTSLLWGITWLGQGKLMTQTFGKRLVSWISVAKNILKRKSCSCIPVLHYPWILSRPLHSYGPQLVLLLAHGEKLRGDRLLLGYTSVFPKHRSGPAIMKFSRIVDAVTNWLLKYPEMYFVMWSE